MWKTKSVLVRAVGVLGCALGTSGLMAPQAWSGVVGAVAFGNACYIALPGGPNRPRECVAPPVPCDRFDYQCGWFLGIGKSRNQFRERNYRYCGKIDSPQISCDYGGKESCMTFHVYQDKACTIMLCHGEIYYHNCHSDW